MSTRNRKYWLRCLECGRHSFVKIGDEMHIEDTAPPCPKCAGKMTTTVTHRPAY
jgi:DNA-directed RNA polymerase subunit RPC12/RpoP